MSENQKAQPPLDERGPGQNESSGTATYAPEDTVRHTDPSSPKIGESGHARRANDEYFTLEASWLIPVLNRAWPIAGPLYEPAAGRGDLMTAIEGLGIEISGSDLFSYEDQRPDIVTGVDLFSLTPSDLDGFETLVVNLPYTVLDAATQHLLEISEGRCALASLVRLEWMAAGRRRDLVHRNRRYAGTVVLTRRPRWIEGSTEYPRHSFAWQIWGAEPRVGHPFIAFGGPNDTE